MTNREYIEKNNISIPEAIKMWRKATQNSIWDYIFDTVDEKKIDKWLKETRYENHKFEVGDFVIKENEKIELEL